MDALVDDYRQAGFGGHLGFGHHAVLLIVDVVRAYIDQGSPLRADVEPVVSSVAQLQAEARSAGVPVIHTRVRFDSVLDGGVFFRKVPALRVFVGDSPLGSFCPGVEPIGNETVITKQYASAFAGTPLAANLTAERVDTVVIAGLTTSGCIRATAVDACQNGFVPIVVREAVGDRDQSIHDANLFDLDAKYADVVPLAEVLELWATT